MLPRKKSRNKQRNTPTGKTTEKGRDANMKRASKSQNLHLDMNTGPTLYKHKYILPDAGADICTDKCENVYSLMLYINMYKYTHTHIYIHMYV